MPAPGLTVGVIFGGRSVEHDVSVITGIQACEVLAARHRPVPIYIDRDGRWLAGPQLRRIEFFRGDGPGEAPEVALDLASGELRAREAGRGLLGRGRQGAATTLDVVIPATHGTHGEDGCLQGTLELAGLPYAGPPLEAAVLAMNKALTKATLRAAGLPVVEDLIVARSELEDAGAIGIAERARARFGYPLYAKPASLGSSVGVARCASDSELAEALELVFELDRTALIEPAIEGGMEINCAVLGHRGASPRASACEQPLASTDFLSFEDKYMSQGKGGAIAADSAKAGGMSSAQRVIPAPVDEQLTSEVQRLAIATFEALGASGVARVDMLLDAHQRVFVNECNTIPGSFAFYLWEPVGCAFVDLIDALIDCALEEHAQRRELTRTFQSNLLAQRGSAMKA